MRHPSTCPHDRIALELSCRSYAQNKAQSTIPTEFFGYWWLFRTQHLLRYSARLVEEMKVDGRSPSSTVPRLRTSSAHLEWKMTDFRPFQVCHFKMVTTHCYYYCRLGRRYKLLDVLLDASICLLSMISPWKRYILIGAAILKSGLPFIWATLPIIFTKQSIITECVCQAFYLYIQRKKINAGQ